MERHRQSVRAVRPSLISAPTLWRTLISYMQYVVVGGVCALLVCGVRSVIYAVRQVIP